MNADHLERSLPTDETQKEDGNVFTDQKMRTEAIASQLSASEESE